MRRIVGIHSIRLQRVAVLARFICCVALQVVGPVDPGRARLHHRCARWRNADAHDPKIGCRLDYTLPKARGAKHRVGLDDSGGGILKGLHHLLVRKK